MTGKRHLHKKTEKSTEKERQGRLRHNSVSIDKSLVALMQLMMLVT